MKTHRLTLAALASTIAFGAGLALAGAPASAVVVHLPVSTFGSFAKATGVAVDQSSGNVFVADSAANVVRVFGAEGGSPAGGLPSELTGALTPAKGFAFDSEPTGVAVAPNGAIYVTDVKDSVIDEFRVNASKEYEYVCQITGFGFEDSACLKNEHGVEVAPKEVAFSEPLGMAVDRKGNLYIADYGSSAVYEYNAAGEDVEKFVSPVGHPQDIAVDSRGDIYVRAYTGGGGGQEAELERNSLYGPVAAVVNPNEGVTGEAFDLASNRLLLSFGSYVEEYDENTRLPFAFGSEILNEARGVAVNEATDDVYVANDGTTIEVFGSSPPLANPTTGGAVGVSQTIEQVEGTVNPESNTLEAGCEVQYGKTAAYGNSVACNPEKVGTGEAPVKVTANLTGLEAATEYHYRIVATNENGPLPGEDRTFMSTPAVAGVFTGEASSIGKMSVTLNGTLKPEGIETHYYFEYGTEAGVYGSTTPLTEADNAAEAHMSATLSGLAVNTTYYYRLVAVNKYGQTHAANSGSVTTLPDLPVVLSQTATQIYPSLAQTGAEEQIDSTVNPENSNTTYHIVYGLTAGYGSSAPAADLELGTGTQGLQAELKISGLQPGATYHYAIVATNRGGSTTGPDETFTTAAASPPIVTTGPASEISQNSASISGSVDPQGIPTSYEFDFGTDTAYGSRFFGEVGAGTEAKALSINLQGLAPDTTYHYRLVATSLYGTVIGADETFTTPAFSAALINAPSGAPLVPEPVFSPSTTGAPTYADHANGKAKKKKKTKPRGRKKAPHRDGQRRSR